MGKINAYCKICGTGYHMCLSCKDYAKLHPWQAHTDTSEHYKIFQVLRGYGTGVYSREEARDRLLNLDLSDKGSYKDNIQSQIEKILDEPRQVKKAKIKKHKFIVADNNINENSMNESEKLDGELLIHSEN